MLSPSLRPVETTKEVHEEGSKQSHVWGEGEDEIGLHITSSVEPLQSLHEQTDSVTPVTLDNAVLDIPLSTE